MEVVAAQRCAEPFGVWNAERLANKGNIVESSGSCQCNDLRPVRERMNEAADLAVGLAEVVLGLRQSVRFIDGNTSEIGGTQSISNSHVLELLRRKVEQTAAPRHILQHAAVLSRR